MDHQVKNIHEWTKTFHSGDSGLHLQLIHECGGGGGGVGGTNLQAEQRHSQYEKHNVAGMTEGGG